MNYYNEIKDKLIQSEIYDKIKDYSKDISKIKTYFEIGKLLSEAGKEYGKNIIKQYSEKLMVKVGKKYNLFTLYRMRKFYEIFNNEKLSTMWPILSWSHYRELIRLKSIDEIIYYIYISKQKNLTQRQLQDKIRNKEYDRLSDDTKNKIIKSEQLKIDDLIPNPILINNTYDYNVISEKALQKVILEDIESFMKELGNGFCFIGSEYKIKIGNRYNYIDLLLFNYEYNCFTVVELKVTELKKEHIGQIQVYMNYIDNNLRKMYQDKTIGIIICKKDKQFLTKRNHLLKQQICYV